MLPLTFVPLCLTPNLLKQNRNIISRAINYSESKRRTYGIQCELRNSNSGSNNRRNQKEDSDRASFSTPSNKQPNGGATGGLGGGSDGKGRSYSSSGEGDIPKLDFTAACALAKELNLNVQDLPQHLWFLSTEQVTAYLAVTSGGVVRFLAKAWPAWQQKLLADPNFPFKLLMEETLGLGLGFSGMIAARGKQILKELDFAICDLVVGAAMNFILVWLLTPTINIQQHLKSHGSWQRYLSNLPAHCFASSSSNVAFSLSQRIVAFLYKGLLFASCGFLGSMVGTTVAYSLLYIRRKMLKDTSSSRQLPNLFVNSLAWAGFMFVSSNPRYQILSGIERLMFHIMPISVARISTGVLRTVNNIAGGASWVLYARAIGLQKHADER
ncbi:protein reticulata-related 3, chloroplastic [Galdieria sulphuraria]|uniref:Uncharacterized protein n=1 Tax=Galdieria sulphuraria TaxID=130081 RepID=M2Y5X5_GALSU|nr:uncharacterized protein Gasu_13320 [Galdieria sulphuraria]EME31368.1 hypothetical protein Gasu_13320 [Galdieria sulphuraria]GJD07248.1 protein reticulata-related 3, chloroplastic [Galdieria sulphuraria]|eukprot:XP_005707888.1 hypothetical protein Gasu_13320 [Galdieria sulphuraria]